MTTTEERIAKLERSTARWRFATVGMVGVLAVGLMAGQGLSSKALTDLETVMLDAMLTEAEPRVVGVSNTGESPSRFVRVWSDGTTELMEYPYWDAATEAYYASGNGQPGDYYPRRAWRPVVDAPIPGP